MANNAGKTVATLLIGAAVGAAVGYVLGTDKDKRQEQVDRLKNSIDRLKAKLGRKASDIEDEIFSA
ncbi:MULTISPECIES: YtxH domain-containing protein [Taibaiella]|uniref:YtxH domain-containing protein n=1 Tax=Taibaiella TaxID=1434702 RepID=UPI000E58F060|nr:MULTISPECIES: YtxH domain-containing protein [Taibaiella]